ncbi:DNA polymerase III subunit gamma/tau [Deinococcus koreensis]|uniref:DNA-directed DNA polymerase n=1 Tax=Deinococcus koreensis TaxID=2054903 RepID=A0A2K3UYD5_9DEIO|nr:DNA polymerase III subunit gamma/tau [Deinococcus koreensis]PNY81547.1 DNA polymerase III, subunit gamma and tau [Deinococcus koreensis]
MSAIYQRARPIRWDQVVGQEHVKDVLKVALEQGRVGHAYLFSGPRGVGKTTTARLIAMTANCTGPLPKPCGECESCLSVRAGSHPDVMEIDAASNNSVDDVRELREKVSLAAMHGGKKIYILDEAHMMSRAAFNALLKTLEEPPGHVIFILATTEPEKILPTILSRCQHYRFRRLTPEEIAGKLSGLAAQEGMTAEPAALQLIGRLADGAMRDGESLLERMLAAGSAITRAGVEEALGLPPGERVRGVAAALVASDAGTALAGAAHLYRDGYAARTVVEGLVAALGSALHAELGLGDEGRLEGADVPRLLRLQAALDAQESRFARSADLQSLELALTHALLAADGGGGSAGAALGAASVPADLVQRLNRLEKELSTLRASGARPGGAPAPVAEFDPTARRGPAPVREVMQAAAQGVTGAVPEPAAPPAELQGTWADVIRQASMQVRAFLKPARTHAESGYVSLTYDGKNAFHAKQVVGKFDDLAGLVLKVFGPVTFELIAPEGGRKVRLGGPPGNGGGGSAPAPAAPAPAAPSSPGVAQTGPAPSGPSSGDRSAAPAPAEVAPFNPAPGRSPRATAAGAPEAPQGSAQLPTPTLPPPSLSQTALSQSGLSQTPPPRPPLRPASVATLDPPAPRSPQRASPDDLGPAPLPEARAAFLDEHRADYHSADPPPAPADAQGGDRLAPPQAARDLYLGEIITEEPDWDDIGVPLEASGPVNLDDAPFAGLSVERSAPRAAAPPSAPPAPAPGPAAAATPSRPGDIRAHPMYEDIKGRFSGRVREIGKNRSPQAAAAEIDLPDEETEADSALG